jgi:hypothetical protein
MRNTFSVFFEYARSGYFNTRTAMTAATAEIAITVDFALSDTVIFVEKMKETKSKENFK